MERLTYNRMQAIQLAQDEVYKHFGIGHKASKRKGGASEREREARNMMVGIVRGNIKCTLNDVSACCGINPNQVRHSIDKFNDSMDTSFDYAKQANEMWKQISVEINKRGLEGELL